MLSMGQLNKMLDAAGSFDEPMLRRHWYARFASIALNILAMIIVIPFFITKDAVIVSRQAIKGGAIALTILFGGMVVMLMPIGRHPFDSKRIFTSDCLNSYCVTSYCLHSDVTFAVSRCQ